MIVTIPSTPYSVIVSNLVDRYIEGNPYEAIYVTTSILKKGDCICITPMKDGYIKFSSRFLNNGQSFLVAGQAAVFFSETKFPGFACEQVSPPMFEGNDGYYSIHSFTFKLTPFCPPGTLAYWENQTRWVSHNRITKLKKIIFQTGDLSESGGEKLYEYLSYKYRLEISVCHSDDLAPFFDFNPVRLTIIKCGYSIETVVSNFYIEECDGKNIILEEI